MQGLVRVRQPLILPVLDVWRLTGRYRKGAQEAVVQAVKDLKVQRAVMQAPQAIF